MPGGWGCDEAMRPTATKLSWDMSWFGGRNAMYEVRPLYKGERYLVVVATKSETIIMGAPDRNAGRENPYDLRELHRFQGGKYHAHKAALRAIGNYEIKDVEGPMNMKEMMAEFEAVERSLEGRKARREPEANRLTPIMGPGVAMAYRKWAGGQNKKGHEVKFCISNYVNVAGYFLIWVEVDKPSKYVKRNYVPGPRLRMDWACSKNPATAMKKMIAKANAFCKRQGKAPMFDENGKFVRDYDWIAE